MHVNEATAKSKTCSLSMGRRELRCKHGLAWKPALHLQVSRKSPLSNPGTANTGGWLRVAVKLMIAAEKDPVPSQGLRKVVTAHSYVKRNKKQNK